MMFQNIMKIIAVVYRKQNLGYSEFSKNEM